MTERPRDSPANRPNPDNLPTPYEAEGHQYLRLRSSTDPLNPRTVANTCQALHGLEPDVDTGWFDRFRGGTTPTFESLLITDETAAIDHLLGIDPPEALDALRTVVRNAIPPTYECTRTEWDPVQLPTDGHLAAVEYLGDPERNGDEYTQLKPFESFTHEDTRVPLATIAEAMATSDVPMVAQTVFQPLGDLTSAAGVRASEIKDGSDTFFGKAINAINGPPLEELDLSAAEEQRLEELHEKDLRRAFVVNARVIALADTKAAATRAIQPCTSAFGDVGTTSYGVTDKPLTSTDPANADVFTRLRERTVIDLGADSLLPNWVPGSTTRSRGIVADPTEVGSFAFIDGTGLTPDAQRALHTVPSAKTSIPRPPQALLERFRTEGLVLGQPRTHDGTPSEPIALPPADQPLNVGWIGQIGSGKSTGILSAVLENVRATDGPEILLLPKGGQMAREYCQCHYAEYGDLEDVYYFDCAEWLPALSFFDIRPDLEAGVPRAVAVQDRVGHYVDIVRQLMGPEQYDRAPRSGDVIRYLLRAQYDPIHGRDAITNDQLLGAINRLQDRETPPAVSNPTLDTLLDGLVADQDPRTFANVMNGARNRVEEISGRPHLTRIFNHRPSGIVADQPMVDLEALLDEDAVLIFDTGRLRPAAKHGLTLAVLSQFWSALRRRRRRRPPSATLPLANFYVEEAASVASSELLKRLLAWGREFRCSMSLVMQFPAQLQAADAEVYAELLNNVGTYVTSSINVDHDLAHRFATEAMGKEAVANRLRGLSRGEWLVDVPGEFGGEDPEPFLVESLGLPDGHPDSDGSLARGFDDAHEAAIARTRRQYGLSVDDGDASTGTAGLGSGASTDAGRPSTAEAATSDAEAGDREGEPAPVDELATSSGSVFQMTNRMPEVVEYDAASGALVCTDCDGRHEATAEGMRTAIQCCHDLAAVDRDDVPICSLNLALSPAEVEGSQWEYHQLAFLQAVHNAQQLRYDPIEYDIVHDSMIRLKEDICVDQAGIDDLLDADLLRHDGDHPHRYYSVTSAGRDIINEEFQRGIDFGHGKGDLAETSQHVAMNEGLRRLLDRTYAQDPDHPGEEVVPYYEIREGKADAAAFMGDADDADTVEKIERRRLDCVVLDADGNVVIAAEAERVNNDVHRAAPADFDKMAACDPEEAIWVVLTQSDGHDVLEALQDPPDGQPRVTSEYSSTTPPHQFTIDEPGFTQMYNFTHLQAQLTGRDES